MVDKHCPDEIMPDEPMRLMRAQEADRLGLRVVKMALIEGWVYVHLSARPRAVEKWPQGLGDRLAKLLRWAGVEALVKRVERRTGWRCGCERRQAALNRLGEAVRKWVSTRRP